MIATRSPAAADPRLALAPGEQQALALRTLPQVGRPHRAGDGFAMAFGVIGALALGALTLLGLDDRRTRAAAPVAAVAVPAPPARAPAAVRTVATPAPAIEPAPPAPPPAPDPNRIDPGQSRAMPMVYDNTAAAGSAATAAAVAAGADTGAGATRDGLSADELFAVRAAGDEVPRAQAQPAGDLRNTIVQGTLLPAVLETAINSDLPGFVRAVVSRDVRGFDGGAVLVPRGSRLVGQYKSGLAAGQSRAYIVWTRLIRPDGVSVQLGSPAMDTTGEVGLPGEVNRHFWQRFGASLLLTVVSGAASTLGDGSSVVVASSGAQNAAGAALETNGKIPPTVRVPLGTPIQVFVARDLDFAPEPAAGTDAVAAVEVSAVAAPAAPASPVERDTP